MYGVCNLICIIQARMSSKRLPMKMLKMVNKKNILERVYCQVIKSNKIKFPIVATSLNKEDDLIYKFCKKKNFNVFRGSLNDVSKRFIDIIQYYSLEKFIRINGDSPFILPALIDSAIDFFDQGNYDLVTNIFPRSYPKGQSVEVVKSSALIDSYQFQSSSQKEHVTQYFYENSSKFNIKNFNLSSDFNYLSLAIDNQNDLANARKMSKIFDKKNLNIKDLIDLITKVR